MKQGITDPEVPKHYSTLDVDKYALNSVAVGRSWETPKIEVGMPKLDPGSALLLKLEISPADPALFHTFMQNDKADKHVTRVLT